MTIEEMEDYVLLQEMTNLTEEEKVTIPFAEAKNYLDGFSYNKLFF